VLVTVPSLLLVEVIKVFAGLDVTLVIGFVVVYVPTKQAKELPAPGVNAVSGTAVLPPGYKSSLTEAEYAHAAKLQDGPASK
jgi:hypothetical protein